MKTSKISILVALTVFGAVISYADTPPAPRLWLGLNGNYSDAGTSPNTHAVSEVNWNFGGSYNGVFANDPPNGCSISNLYLPGDGSQVEVDNVGDIIFNNTFQFSVSAWVKTTSGGTVWSKSTLAAIGDGSYNTITCYIDTGSGKLVVDSSYRGALWSTATNLKDGNWHNVVVTKDTAENMRIYIDGSLDNSANVWGSNEGANNDFGDWSFTVGGTLNAYQVSQTGTWNPLTGEVAEVAVWDKALTTNQAVSLFANCVPTQTIDITQEPANSGNTIQGLTHTFTVAGTPVGGLSGTMTYQWQSNGVAIVNATNASYTTPPLTTNYIGSVYSCRLTVGSVTVQSLGGTLENVIVPVLPSAEALWLRFENSLADSGYGLHHFIYATNLPGLGAYTGSYSANVANANNGTASLSLPGDGSHIIVSNKYPTDLSFNGQFTVSAWIKPNANKGVIWAYSPDTNNVIVGGTHTIACWVNGGNGVSLDVFFVGGTSTGYNVNDGNWHNVVVTHGSTTWRIYIDGFQRASGGFAAANEGANSDAGKWHLMVGATDNYNWPNEGVNGEPYNGLVDEVTYWPTALPASQVAYVYTLGNPSVSILITNQPAATSLVNPGANLTLTVGAQLVGASGTLTYQWQSNGVAIAGATSASYTTPPLTAANDATYNGIVSFGSVSVTSDDAVVTVIAPPPGPRLWLTFENSLIDHGYGLPHWATGSSINGGSFNGSFMNSAPANGGSHSLYLPGDGSCLVVSNAYPSDLNFNSGGGNEFTVSAWVKTTDYGVIWAYDAPAVYTPDQRCLAVWVPLDSYGDPGTVSLDINFVNDYTTSVIVNDGNWHNVAVTHDAANNWRFYIDGSLNATYNDLAANEGDNLDGGTWNLLIGGIHNSGDPNNDWPVDNNTSGDPFKGFIDEVAVWDSALSLGKIVSVYQSGVPRPVLNIAPPAGGNVTLSWSGSGWKLQQNSSLTNPAGWGDVTGGTSSPVPVTIGAGPEFFRLVSQ
jgi:hypothetical protein